MTAAACSLSDTPVPERRRFPRYPIAVPVDVVVLRSGIPSTIPGRSIDLGQGGVAAILAGQLRIGESVGVEITLPFGMEPIQAKAVVRDQQQLCCRLQFVALRPESHNALNTWVKVVMPQAPAKLATVAPADGLKVARPASPRTGTHDEARRRRQSRKAKWMAMAPLLLVLSLVVAWWSWQNGWVGVAQRATAQASSPQQVPTVPGSVMERSLLHRVEPAYPDEAVRKKTEGLVVVAATIGADGAVKHVQPLSGPDILERAAVDAVKWWRFQPYEVQGQPIEVRTTIEVDFRLHD